MQRSFLSIATLLAFSLTLISCGGDAPANNTANTAANTAANNTATKPIVYVGTNSNTSNTPNPANAGGKPTPGSNKPAVVKSAPQTKNPAVDTADEAPPAPKR